MIKGIVIKRKLNKSKEIALDIEYTFGDNTKVIEQRTYDFFNYSEAQVTSDIKERCENLMKERYFQKECQKIVDTPSSPSLSYDCNSVEIVLKPTVYADDGITVITPEEKIVITDTVDIIKEE